MSKKNIYWIGTAFFSVVILFTFGYYKSYQNVAQHNNAFQGKEQAYREDNKTKEEKEENQANKASAVQSRISDSTTICWEFYYVKEKVSRTKSTLAPDYLIGLTRKEVVSYVEDYMKNLSEEEKKEGLLSYELVSFSTDKVVLKKSYEAENKTVIYYIGLKDDMVVVYCEDRKTIYEHTGIMANTLPQEEQSLLKKGIEVKGEKELFGILEGYSS